MTVIDQVIQQTIDTDNITHIPTRVIGSYNPNRRTPYKHTLYNQLKNNPESVRNKFKFIKQEYIDNQYYSVEVTVWYFADKQYNVDETWMSHMPSLPDCYELSSFQYPNAIVLIDREDTDTMGLPTIVETIIELGVVRYHYYDKGYLGRKDDYPAYTEINRNMIINSWYNEGYICKKSQRNCLTERKDVYYYDDNENVPDNEWNKLDRFEETKIIPSCVCYDKYENIISVSWIIDDDLYRHLYIHGDTIGYINEGFSRFRKIESTVLPEEGLSLRIKDIYGNIEMY